MDLTRITFKEVTVDDHDRVIAIRADKDIRDNGEDDLPGVYKAMCNTQSTTGYAAVIDGEFIAFQFVQIIDNGKAYVTRFARVKKIYEGQGVYRAFDKFTEQLYRINGRKHVVTFEDDNKHLMSKVYTEEVRLITKRKYVENWMCTSNFDVAIMDELLGSQNSRFLCQKDMSNIFRSKAVCSRLFPEDIIVCFWVPLKPLEANFPFIFFEHTKTVGTFEPECILISFGTFYRCQFGFVYSIDIYGNSHIKLREHIQLHFKYLCQLIEKDIEETILVYILTDNIETKHIDDLMSKYGFQKGKTRLSYHIEK